MIFNVPYNPSNSVILGLHNCFILINYTVLSWDLFLEWRPTGSIWFIYSTFKYSFPSILFPIKPAVGNGSWHRLKPWLWAGIGWQSASWPNQMHDGAIHVLLTASLTLW